MDSQLGEAYGATSIKNRTSDHDPRYAEQVVIRNPVLRGFHPDPSITRVDGDYYVATSTFEWFPGVRLHHSRDLRHFRAIGHALTRDDQLNLIGVPSSGGVWAPHLSHHAGTFYLLYTNVKSWGGSYGADTHNYLVTADAITGPWSAPVYLHSRGFDPSLFFDLDGRAWLLNVLWDYRPGRPDFGGIEIQEYCIEQQRLLGAPRLIFSGTSLGITEAPQLYLHAGYYYLITAEGGTGAGHAVTCARSRQLFGPYEVDPGNPLLTSRGHPELALQRAGHASLVEKPAGEVYIAHLCSRPVGSQRRSILGRETALQRCVWSADGWLRLATAEHLPATLVASPALANSPWPTSPSKDDFDQPTLGPEFQTLRTSAGPDWLSLSARPSSLRLWGREAPSSLHRQSLVARRLESTQCRVETLVAFEPRCFQALAGLLCWYDTRTHYYLAITWDESLGRCLRLFLTTAGVTRELCDPVQVQEPRRVTLRAEFRNGQVCFAYALENDAACPIGPVCDATLLSDEAPEGLEPFYGSFTGTVVGMGVHDMSGDRAFADFEYFLYEEAMHFRD